MRLRCEFTFWKTEFQTEFRETTVRDSIGVMEVCQLLFVPVKIKWQIMCFIFKKRRYQKVIFKCGLKIFKLKKLLLRNVR